MSKIFFRYISNVKVTKIFYILLLRRLYLNGVHFTRTGHLSWSGPISCAHGPHVARGYLTRQHSFRLKTQVLTPSLGLFSLFCQFPLTLFYGMSFLFYSVVRTQ